MDTGKGKEGQNIAECRGVVSDLGPMEAYYSGTAILINPVMFERF